MNSDFPRILSLLRKEKGISQKNAANELQISQSLLSHYEKGIRECGLAFVVKAANFYDVSCDYLLGKSPERKGTTLAMEELTEQQNKDNNLNLKSLKLTYRKKILICSLNVVIDIISKSKNNKLIDKIFDFLYLSIYIVFRIIFRINKKNNNEMFIIDDNIADQIAMSEIVKLEGLANSDAKNENDEDDELKINNQVLEQKYPNNHNALLNLLKSCENNIQKNIEP